MIYGFSIRVVRPPNCTLMSSAGDDRRCGGERRGGADMASDWAESHSRDELLTRLNIAPIPAITVM